VADLNTTFSFVPLLPNSFSSLSILTNDFINVVENNNGAWSFHSIKKSSGTAVLHFHRYVNVVGHFDIK
jgi:hypothetical protein